jgi:predicted RNA-binding Zn ribbon-like protein
MATPSFGFIAGHVALDFVNTVDWRGEAEWRGDAAGPQELLGTFEDLLAWAAAAKLLRPRDVRAMTEAAQRDKGRAARALRRARRLRELLARVLTAAGSAAAPEAGDVRLLNAFLASALRRRRLELRGTAFDWSWESSEKVAFDAMLWPIVLAAADLLASEHRTQIHVCGAAGCGWLFLDTSRNQRRRWCSMQGCGNRAKARRFYERTRETGQ